MSTEQPSPTQELVTHLADADGLTRGMTFLLLAGRALHASETFGENASSETWLASPDISASDAQRVWVEEVIVVTRGLSSRFAEMLALSAGGVLDSDVLSADWLEDAWDASQALEREVEGPTTLALFVRLVQAWLGEADTWRQIALAKIQAEPSPEAMMAGWEQCWEQGRRFPRATTEELRVILSSPLLDGESGMWCEALFGLLGGPQQSSHKTLFSLQGPTRANPTAEGLQRAGLCVAALAACLPVQTELFHLVLNPVNVNKISGLEADLLFLGVRLIFWDLDPATGAKTISDITEQSLGIQLFRGMERDPDRLLALWMGWRDALLGLMGALEQAEEEHMLWFMPSDLLPPSVAQAWTLKTVRTRQEFEEAMRAKSRLGIAFEAA